MAAYANDLRRLLDDPNAIAQTPGYKFQMDRGLEGVARSNSRQRGSGNVLAALMKYGQGLASTERGAEIDRLGRLEGQAGQYDLGAEANRLTGVRDANSFTLGTGANDIARTRASNDLALGTRAANTADARVGYDYSLGKDQIANTRTTADQQFGLGMYKAGNDFSVANDANTNTANNNWWNRQSNAEQNANTAANNQNNYNVNWYNADTSRGRALSDDWWNPQRQARQPLTRRYV